MTVFDYDFPSIRHNFLKIEDDTLICPTDKLTDVTFRNFPMLRIDDLCLEGCSFENCHTVYLTDCTTHNCIFSGTQTIYADRTPISDSTFRQLICANDTAICLEDSEISGCTFRDVNLTNLSYLIRGVGDVWLQRCCFENIRTDRPDRELFFCEKTVGRIFKQQVQLCIVDTESCTGLDGDRCISAPAADPRQEVIRQATEQGLLTPQAMEAIEAGIRFDEPRADPQILALPIYNYIHKIPVYNCLTRAGMQTVGDLAKLDIFQILQIRNIGKVVIHSVTEMLHSLDITGTAWDYLQ